VFDVTPPEPGVPVRRREHWHARQRQAHAEHDGVVPSYVLSKLFRRRSRAPAHRRRQRVRNRRRVHRLTQTRNLSPRPLNHARHRGFVQRRVRAAIAHERKGAEKEIRERESLDERKRPSARERRRDDGAEDDESGADDGKRRRGDVARAYDVSRARGPGVGSHGIKVKD